MNNIPNNTPYSETAGSFIRNGNYPLEANYIFNSELELKEFYSDDIYKTHLHEGLLKIVKGEKLTLYWVVNINNELKFIPLILEDSIDKIFDRLAELRNDINNISGGSIDLSNYFTKDETLNKLDEKVDKTNTYTKTEVDAIIKNIIGTAPEALDTLGEIADALNGNGDAIEAINGILAGKADKADTYTKDEVNALGLQLKAIAESRLPIDSFNEWSETVATKEYVDNAIAGIELTDYAKKADVYTKPEVDKLIADTITGGTVDLSNYYTKQEVNLAITEIEERLNEWEWHEG